MKIKILGTAAAEGFPAMFCECSTCERARKAGGKNLRTRTQALIDETLLIDFGPDTLSHTLYGNLKLHKVTDVLITHSHCDHLLLSDFENRKDGFCIINDKKPLNIYASAPAIDAISSAFASDFNTQKAISLNEIRPFEKIEIGKYEVFPLKADHDTRTQPVFYLISDKEKTILYATDTGIFPEETVAFLKELQMKIDLIFIDCTAMLLKGWVKNHMGLDTNVLQINELKDLGLLKDDTRIYLHHFSHNGGATHDELVPIAEQYGFGVAFDGMTEEI